MCFYYCDSCCCDCILVLLAVIFPPLPVMIKSGICSCDLLINICLCLLGWLPGMIHAWYIILAAPRQMVIDDEEAQFFIITPPQASHVTINKHPNQTMIKFNHPEPFLESSNRNNHCCRNNEHSSSIIENNNLSPLSNAPVMNTHQHCGSHNDPNYVPSPLSRPEDFYGAVDDTDLNDDGTQPPSYENVMNETAKQFK